MAELEFRQLLLEKDNETESANQVKDQLQTLSEQANSLSEQMKKAGIELIQPNKVKIKEFDEKLSGFPQEEILDSVKTKNGDVYNLLAERGKIIKRNFENRSNIAKISLLASKLDTERKAALYKAIDHEAFETTVDLKDWDEKARMRFVNLLRRIGLDVGLDEHSLSAGKNGVIEEKLVELSGVTVWVSDDVSSQLNKNLELMSELNKKIQLKNAERQIKSFSDDEEKEFLILQQDYLKLLKEQDDLIKDFKDEDSISVSLA